MSAQPGVLVLGCIEYFKITANEVVTECVRNTAVLIPLGKECCCFDCIWQLIHEARENSWWVVDCRRINLRVFLFSRKMYSNAFRVRFLPES